MLEGSEARLVRVRGRGSGLGLVCNKSDSGGLRAQEPLIARQPLNLESGELIEVFGRQEG